MWFGSPKWTNYSLLSPTPWQTSRYRLLWSYFYATWWEVNECPTCTEKSNHTVISGDARLSKCTTMHTAMDLDFSSTRYIHVHVTIRLADVGCQHYSWKCMKQCTLHRPVRVGDVGEDWGDSFQKCTPFKVHTPYNATAVDRWEIPPYSHIRNVSSWRTCTILCSSNWIYRVGRS